MYKKLQLVFVMLAAVLLSSKAEASLLIEDDLVPKPHPPKRYETLPYYPPHKKPFPLYQALRSADPQQYETLPYEQEIDHLKFQILPYNSNRNPSDKILRARRSPQSIQTLPYYPKYQKPKYQTLPYYYPNQNRRKTYLVRRSTESQNYEQYKLENLEKNNPDSRRRPRPLTWPTLTPHIYTSSAE